MEKGKRQVLKVPVQVPSRSRGTPAPGADRAVESCGSAPGDAIPWVAMGVAGRSRFRRLAGVHPPWEMHTPVYALSVPPIPDFPCSGLFLCKAGQLIGREGLLPMLSNVLMALTLVSCCKSVNWTAGSGLDSRQRPASWNRSRSCWTVMPSWFYTSLVNLLL